MQHLGMFNSVAVVKIPFEINKKEKENQKSKNDSDQALACEINAAV